MSYLVLARRWRPKRFDQLIGQPHVSRTLLNGLRQGRIAHAYLFSGPRGVGKTTTARLVARAINCSNPNDGEPCGSCQFCSALEQGSAIDMIEIDAASSRGIDDIRQLRDSVRYTPIQGKAKVYIIDEVHMLTNEAFNALLKTLEEPPAHAYFCLATTAPQKVPSTILSRCQRFDFRRVPAADIRGHLQNICESEHIKHDIDALDIIARKADGSVRDGLSLLDQVLAYANGQALRGDAEEVVGVIRYDLFFKALNLLESASEAEAFILDEEIAYSGYDPQDYLIGLQNHIVQVLQAKSIGLDKVDIPDDLMAEFDRATNAAGDSDLIRLLQLCSAAETDIRRNFNPRTRLQLLLLKFAAFDRSVVVGEVINSLRNNRLSSDGDRYSPSNAPSTPNSPSAVPSTPKTNANPGHSDRAAGQNSDKSQSNTIGAHQPNATDDVGDDMLIRARKVWNDVCDRLAKKHNSKAQMIKHDGMPNGWANGRLTLTFKSQFHKNAAESCRWDLREELTAALGEIELEFEVGDLPETKEETSEVGDDPAVSLLIERFGAKPAR